MPVRDIQPAKKVVTETAIPVTPEGSAPSVEVNMDTLVNNAAQLGSSLDIGSDVVEGNLDWSEMAPLQEFDNIAAGRGVDQLPEQQPQPQEDVQYAEQEPEYSPQDDTNLTEAMKQRIANIKRKEAEALQNKDAELATKDAVISARNMEIEELRKMTDSFVALQREYTPPTGDAVAVENQIRDMDARLDEDGDTFTAAEVAKHVQQRQDLQQQLLGIKSSQAKATDILGKQEAMRKQSDEYVKNTYKFVSDPKSESYTVLKDQAYPMLESIVPNFSKHPQDMVIAAELTKLMVNANKYEQIMGNVPAPRVEAAPMEGDRPQPRRTVQRQPQQTLRTEVKQLAESGGMNTSNIAKLLQQRGYSWRP